MAEFILPKVKNELKAVYKMEFDDGGFYIGSSANLRRRMWGWKYRLESGVKKNYLVTNAFKKTSKVRFVVIEIVDDLEMLKSREDWHIKANWGDAKFLNRSMSAFRGEGVKWTDEQLLKKPKVRTSCCPVTAFDKGGVVLKEYSSIIDASFDYRVSPQRIRMSMKKYGLSVKGVVFRRKNNDGTYIEPPIIPAKKRVGRKGYKCSPQQIEKLRITMAKRIADGKFPSQSKGMVKKNEYGEVIASFHSIGAAAKSMGADVKNFKKLIKKGRLGYYKGFFWELA